MWPFFYDAQFSVEIHGRVETTSKSPTIFFECLGIFLDFLGLFRMDCFRKNFLGRVERTLLGSTFFGKDFFRKDLGLFLDFYDFYEFFGPFRIFLGLFKNFNFTSLLTFLDVLVWTVLNFLDFLDFLDFLAVIQHTARGTQSTKLLFPSGQGQINVNIIVICDTLKVYSTLKLCFTEFIGIFNNRGSPKMLS